MIPAAESSKKNSHVMSVEKFERFFRIADGLDIDKQDLKRHSDLINQKVTTSWFAQDTAKANGRAIIEPVDLPITKGLEECIQEFENIDEQIELRPILDHSPRVRRCRDTMLERAGQHSRFDPSSPSQSNAIDD